MKEFFWAIIAAYVFLYFYAAWLYDGFSIYLALGLFVLLVGQVYWWKKRKANQQVQSEEPAVVVEKPDATPISVWRSPLPYMLILGIIVIASIQWL